MKDDTGIRVMIRRDNSSTYRLIRRNPPMDKPLSRTETSNNSCRSHHGAGMHQAT
jgi:hypothetical protein